MNTLLYSLGLVAIWQTIKLYKMNQKINQLQSDLWAMEERLEKAEGKSGCGC